MLRWSDNIENECICRNLCLKFSDCLLRIGYIKLKGLHFYQKKTPAQVFSCKFCENFKNTVFQNTSKRLLLDSLQKSINSKLKRSVILVRRLFLKFPLNLGLRSYKISCRKRKFFWKKIFFCYVQTNNWKHYFTSYSWLLW